MFLSKLYAENFRIFGSKDKNEHLELSLGTGLNILVGENDSGKSAVVDAIRQVLWTTSLDIQWLKEEDFHVDGETTAKSLTITCKFSDLTTEEQGRFLEYMTVEEGKPCLYVSLMANLREEHIRKGRNISVTYKTGAKGDGPRIEGEIREFLKATYLKPLRDAEKELTGGRGSRLSQILEAYPTFKNQDDKSDPNSLLGIMNKAEQSINDNQVIKEAKVNLNTEFLDKISLKGDALEGDIVLVKAATLRQILEKLDLKLLPPFGVNKNKSVPRGLGFNNALFMATELLLIGGGTDALSLLMIEEPEAHLHPQMQYRLLGFLEEKALGNAQIIVTTHSPNLASSADIKNMIILKKGKTFSLRPDCTKLDPSDYGFLKRFLDVTKSNLFFAKSVVIVEGDAENILLPTIAELLGRSFAEYGVSIVNVGHVGLFRYSKIFQRKSGEKMPIRVACITDRDIIPDYADYVECPMKKDRTLKTPFYESQYTDEKIVEKIQKRKKNDDADGEPVRTFVSDKWTFEYDLANSGLYSEMHIAIHLATETKSKNRALTDAEIKSTEVIALSEIDAMKAKGLNTLQIAALVYKPLKTDNISKPESAQYFADYLIRNKTKYPPAAFESMLPSYLLAAIKFVTGD